MARASTLLVLIAGALCAIDVLAGDPEEPAFSFSGFGTLGVVHSSERNADFTGGASKPNGAGRTRSWNADVDSLLAAQVSAELGANLSAVLQVLSAQRYDNTYTPGVEWANIKYSFTPDFFVRAGRIVMPSFLASGYRNVGYASTWVRPPPEVYGLVPITKSDGVDTSYRKAFGDAVNTVQLIAGDLRANKPGGGQARARQLVGLFDTYELGPLTLRAAYHQAHLTFDAPRAIFDSFRTFGPQGAAIADKFDCDGELAPFTSAGAAFDPGKWFLQAEWSRTNRHCFIGLRSGWYVTGGYRIGKWTPYAIFARAKADNLSDAGLDVSALPPQRVGPATALNAGLNSILAAKPVQDTISFGTRWDFASHAAFTLQWDRTRIGAGSTGTLSNAGPDFRPGGRFTLFSAAVTFLF